MELGALREVPWVPWPMSLVVMFLDRGAGPPREGSPRDVELGALRGVPWVPWPMSLVVVVLDRGAGPPRGGGPREQLLGNPLGGGFRWSAEYC